jgi:hypothetical protein
LHCCSGWSQAVSQQTRSAQLPVPHCEASEHAPPWGTGLVVGVAVMVAVVVAVAVAVAVAVGLGVGPTPTVKLQELVLPALSTHVHVTVVKPTGKMLPGGGKQAKLWTPPGLLQLAT